jgi:serralysin
VPTPDWRDWATIVTTSTTSGDSVVEELNEGNDIIYSSISWTLGEHVERLYLTGSATTTATGNALANTLYGHANSAANVLTGGLGNDIYYLGAGTAPSKTKAEASTASIPTPTTHWPPMSSICISMSPPPPP